MTSKSYILAPSILAADFTQLGNQITEVEKAGADWIHIDVMDGHFVPNISMGPFIVEHCRKITELPLDVHLMIEKPEQYISEFADAGANSLTIHMEADRHLDRTLREIRRLGCQPGLAINPATPLAPLSEVIELLDLVLIMTVNPGYGGQSFLNKMPRKIMRARKMLHDTGSTARLEVDGGISENTVSLARAAGADTFVAGNALFNHPQGVQAGVEALLDLLQVPAEDQELKEFMP